MGVEKPGRAVSYQDVQELSQVDTAKPSATKRCWIINYGKNSPK
jgi:hypothetical protein